MKFHWSKRSAYEQMKTLLSGFTPEEIEILDGKDCFIPHMYSFLLEEASHTDFASNLNLDIAKFTMEKIFYSRGDKVRDPRFQKNLYTFLTRTVRCR